MTPSFDHILPNIYQHHIECTMGFLLPRSVLGCKICRPIDCLRQHGLMMSRDHTLCKVLLQNKFRMGKVHTHQMERNCSIQWDSSGTLLQQLKRTHHRRRQCIQLYLKQWRQCPVDSFGMQSGPGHRRTFQCRTQGREIANQQRADYLLDPQDSPCKHFRWESLCEDCTSLQNSRCSYLPQRIAHCC